MSCIVYRPMCMCVYIITMPRRAEYCDYRVCLSVCLSVCPSVCVCLFAHSPEITRPNFTKFCLHDACGHRSILLWQRYKMFSISAVLWIVRNSSNATSRTIAFDVMTSYNWPYGGVTLLQQHLCSVVRGLTALLRGIGLRPVVDHDRHQC